MKLSQSCPICNKKLERISSIKLSQTETLNSYKCGHVFCDTRSYIEPELHSVDGLKRARAYQRDGVDWILNHPERSDLSCVLADQMRLGKTPQALLTLKSVYNSKTPCLIIVRATNLWQWIEEYRTWVSPLPGGIYPITSTKGFIPPGFKSYIISMDTLGRGDLVEKLLKFGFKLVIVDEAHSFKNTAAKRTQALQMFMLEISKKEITYDFKFRCINCFKEWTEKVTKLVTKEEERISKSSYCPVCHSFNSQSATRENAHKRQCDIILLTGTPIKNKADEYFVPLNLVAPELFPVKERFRRDWLMQDQKGQWSRVNPYRMDAFKKLIAPYVLRREKEDVYQDCPKLDRIFTVIEIADERLKKAYNSVLTELEATASRTNYSYFETIGELTKLRQICGLAKVDFTADYAETMLMDSQTAKLAVGVHHHIVVDNLKMKFQEIGSCMTLTGKDSPERKFEIMKEFETRPEQLLIINMLAGGVGLDFHYVNNVLVLERQWNSADEEQFEYRFYNPDRSIKTTSTTVEYILAKDTIDSFFHDLVESKRRIFGETIANNWSLQDDPGSFRELVERTISHRL